MFDLKFYKIISATTNTTLNLTSKGYNMRDVLTNKKKLNPKVLTKHKDDYDIMKCFYHIYSIGHNEYFDK